jgi:hypothetical protein
MGPEDYCEECGHHENQHLAGGCTAIVFPEVDDGTSMGDVCGCMAYEVEDDD